VEIILAKNAGFCYGVARAVKAVEENIWKEKLYTYGSLIHNKMVTDRLLEKGVKVINCIDEIESGTIVIRAHGVEECVYNRMKEKGIECIDCTCPHVKRIHEIVQEEKSKGRKIIIVGNSEHPEIIGIKSFANEGALVIESMEAVEIENFENHKYSIVVQTTFIKQKFQSIVDLISYKVKDVKVFDTICSATHNRQKEAEHISKHVDVMIVLGDKRSSNTAKLYEICKKNCENTYLTETIRDLQLNISSINVKIGITAGASTPPDIIKEAFITMSEQDNTNIEQSFEEWMSKEPIVILRTGEVVKGTVIAVQNGDISVNLNYKSDGFIPRSEFSDDPNADPSKEVKPGDEIDVFIVRVNDGDGNVLLSKKKVDSRRGILEIEEAFNNKVTVVGKITDIVKGGLIASIKGTRAFVPSSQISNRFIEDLKPFKGKEFTFNILEFDRNKRRLVVGRRDLVAKEQNEVREKVFNSLEVGQKINATVSRIVEFGAFVDLGGVDGLIHISELSWGRVKNVRQILNENDSVTVTVLEVDKEKGKISLSLRDVTNDPWKTIQEKYNIGDVVQGKIVRMVPFGAFVELADGVDGLIHISQISRKHIVKPEDELQVGQVVFVKITEVDMENKRISLSKKEAEEDTDKAEETSEVQENSEVQESSEMQE